LRVNRKHKTMTEQHFSTATCVGERDHTRVATSGEVGGDCAHIADRDGAVRRERHWQHQR